MNSSHRQHCPSLLEGNIAAQMFAVELLFLRLLGTVAESFTSHLGRAPVGAAL